MSRATGLNAARVASRYLTAKTWENPAKLVSDYREALTGIQQEMVSPTRRDYWLKNYFMVVIVKGYHLAEWVVQTRAIPASKVKALEMAVRLMRTRRTNNVAVWYTKNIARLNLLLEAASWPERSAAGELATVGPFKVHNTIGANAKQFAEIQGLFESAARALSTTRDFKKVLYGDVFVVGQIERATSAAWYQIKADDVYIRSLAKKGQDDLQSLIHELGHRYWFKFCSREQRQATSTLYYQTHSSARSEVRLPNVGDTLPVKVRGESVPPVVTAKSALYYTLSSGGQVKIQDVRRLLANTAARAVFPSAYSAKDVEEFFAECFSFYTLGKLKPNLAASFELALK